MQILLEIDEARELIAQAWVDSVDPDDPGYHDTRHKSTDTTTHLMTTRLNAILADGSSLEDILDDLAVRYGAITGGLFYKLVAAVADCIDWHCIAWISIVDSFGSVLIYL